MKAIRQIHKVKNQKISITLPDDFNADEVEVIILSSKNKEYSIPQWQMDEVRESSIAFHKNPKIGLDFNEIIDELNLDFVLSEEQMKILDERANVDRATCLSVEESIARLRRRNRV